MLGYTGRNRARFENWFRDYSWDCEWRGARRSTGRNKPASGKILMSWSHTDCSQIFRSPLCLHVFVFGQICTTAFIWCTEAHLSAWSDFALVVYCSFTFCKTTDPKLKEYRSFYAVVCCPGGSCYLARMSQEDRPTFYRQELNKTVWEVPERYQNLSPVGSGAYGSVW